MNASRLATMALWVCVLLPLCGRAAENERAAVEQTVAQTIRPLMAHYGIPGLAVGIVLHGQADVFDYGVASKAGAKPVKGDTLFEIGSVSKTFTATLVSYAQAGGQLSLSDHPGRFFPALRGSRFDAVNLLHLGTHTPGGLPLQVPDEITDNEQLLGYFQHWQPAYAPGTHRTYSNLSIGLLGLIAAQSLHEDFAALLTDKLFPALGLKSTYLDVPAARLDDYAQGYTDKDVPVRMTPGVLATEAYGVRTTAGDLLRFVEANLGLLALDERWRQAIADTHTGYYRIGGMTQDLIWEQYPYPVDSPTLLAGNSDEMVLQAQPAAILDPPAVPRDDVLINKTGSTNGFSTYVAFVPARKLGIVLLANKRFPIEARVRAAQEILTQLETTP